MQETALNEAWMKRKAIATVATLMLSSIALQAQAQAPATCALPSFKEAVKSIRDCLPAAWPSETSISMARPTWR